MSTFRRTRPLTVFALAAAAAGSLLVSAPAAQAGDHLDACLSSVGTRTSPNGWKIPARNFAQGSSGPCVREIQFDIGSTIGLDPADADNFIDGRFGPNTERYVREFQRQSHLDDDGIVGPKTWESLVSRTKD
ncbi:peptidoglycan-binding protein [Streptomyces sp. NPDC097981]|uniref:peptidoglycan-binding domain-containing protein n=1 Tax=Streptomyces sp. NPDC097981 TaxID=3155428 RepID=UPI003323232D